MSDYQAYVIGRDGRFIRAIKIDSVDDDAAIETAKLFIDGHDIELWLHDRRVATFNAKPEVISEGST